MPGVLWNEKREPAGSGGSEPEHARAFARPSKSINNCIHYEL